MGKSLKPLGTVLGIAGATLVAVGRPALMLPALGLWTISSVIWAWVSWRQREWSLCVLSTVYVVLDLVGLWQWAMQHG